MKLIWELPTYNVGSKYTIHLKHFSKRLTYHTILHINVIIMMVHIYSKYTYIKHIHYIFMNALHIGIDIYNIHKSYSFILTTFLLYYLPLLLAEATAPSFCFSILSPICSLHLPEAGYGGRAWGHEAIAIAHAQNKH